MASRDRFDITKHANGPDSGHFQARSQNLASSNAESSNRPSRENIIRNYNANAAKRARSVKQYSQEAMQNFQEREERTLERQRQRNEYANSMREGNVVSQIPETKHMTQEQARIRARELRAMNRQRSTMTTQESHDRTIVSKENFEAERARRDVFSSRNAARTSNREVIDGRGSIDSRAFNERNELVGYSIDQRDRPDPLVETPGDQAGKWNSQAGQGFATSGSQNGNLPNRWKSDLDKLSDSISGSSQYKPKGFLSSIPLSAKLLLLLIVVLLVILFYLLFS